MTPVCTLSIRSSMTSITTPRWTTGPPSQARSHQKRVTGRSPARRIRRDPPQERGRMMALELLPTC